MRKKIILSFFIQLAWIALCLFIGIGIVNLAFGNLQQPWNYLLGGLIASLIYFILWNPTARRIREINKLLDKDRTICDFIISLGGWNVSTTETDGLKIIITPIGMPKYNLYITYKGERPSNAKIKELHYELTNINSSVSKAHKMNMSLESYIEITMQTLFEHEVKAFKNGNRLNDDVIVESLIELVPKRDERWERFVKNKIYNGELELRYTIGFPLSVLIEETHEVVEGVVTDFSCGLDWGYIIQFDSEIGFNNSPLSKQHIVSEKMLDMIVAKQIKGSDTHYRF